ncbi:unnamed protein product [Diatraea saccharalis]|uniref:Uncharacterized protein n=1 Tax=Diatraea saccharalis TaxID=40085 RepID=A0A9N9QW37_9NEOP|nr:unnamed protein product [Diatraea saccharalis]
METKSPKSPEGVAVFDRFTKKGIIYIAIKGSLHATDCSVFGLQEEVVKNLAKKYEPVINGFSISANVLNAINSLSQLGYKIVSSTGESEITWTMQKDIYC